MKYSLDMHLHTRKSDGNLSYEELFSMLSDEGIEVLSVTDHDSTGDADDISGIALKFGIRYISGVEISSFHSGGEVHILGYGFRNNDAVFENFISQRFEARIERVKEMIMKLNKKSVNISFDEVSSQSPGPYVGRPNIAKVLFCKGLISEYDEAFSDEYIGNSAYAYVPPDKCESTKAIKEIKKAGGLAFLAHPGIYKSNKSFLKGMSVSDITHLKENGLDGIEVYHPKHSFMDTKRYFEIAKRLKLKISIGSDYHHGTYVPIYKKVPIDVLKEVYIWVSELNYH